MWISENECEYFWRMFFDELKACGVEQKLFVCIDILSEMEQCILIIFHRRMCSTGCILIKKCPFRHRESQELQSDSRLFCCFIICNYPRFTLFKPFTSYYGPLIKAIIGAVDSFHIPSVTSPCKSKPYANVTCSYTEWGYILSLFRPYTTIPTGQWSLPYTFDNINASFT